MKKVAFFDIDGTLVSYNTHSIPASTKEGLAELRNKGIKTFISTGRPFAAIDNLEDTEFDGFITMNGAYCMTADKEVIFKQPIPTEQIRLFLEYQKNNNEIPCMAATEDSIHINFFNQDVEEVFKLINFPEVATKPLEEVAQQEIFQLVSFFKEDIEPEIMKNVFFGCESARWNPLFTDIISKGISKQTGIDKVLEYYDFSLDEAIAFGDGGNDIQMLRHVPASVAMGNAKDNVKESASYVTTSVDENGIWNALKHFEVI